MKIPASSLNDYYENLPADRVEAMGELRTVINKNIPKGFAEVLNYGMPAWVVPHALYPAGYHCDPKLPLPFLAIASQKNFIAVYHMGLYADEQMLAWFTKAYDARSAARNLGKLDMGKSCIRFKRPDKIPFDLIGELAGKMSVKEMVGLYERSLKK